MTVRLSPDAQTRVAGFINQRIQLNPAFRGHVGDFDYYQRWVPTLPLSGQNDFASLMITGRPSRFTGIGMHHLNRAANALSDIANGLYDRDCKRLNLSRQEFAQRFARANQIDAQTQEVLELWAAPS